MGNIAGDSIAVLGPRRQTRAGARARTAIARAGKEAMRGERRASAAISLWGEPEGDGGRADSRPVSLVQPSRGVQ
jgi:hypothetical protein